jgi:hypothetical protein
MPDIHNDLVDIPAAFAAARVSHERTVANTDRAALKPCACASVAVSARAAAII